MITVTGFPIISSALYPNSFSALRFQLVIIPFRSLLAMASSEDSTIAARRSAASSSFFCRVMSRTILAAHSLKMLDPLARPDLSQYPRLVILQFLGDDQRNRLADDFLSRIAKQPLRAFVPAGNNSVQVLAGDCILRRLDDRSQTTLCFLSLAR